MTFPALSMPIHLQRLQPPSHKIRMVLDTDTYNEIDDQFAVVYALQSPEQLEVQAIYAAPFYNSRSNGPADGMARSYEEIVRLLDRLNISVDDFVYRGSAGFLSSPDQAIESDAVHHLINLAMASNPVPGAETADEGPLYVVAIGAPTNIASAILLEPKVIERIVVVWLGGQPLASPTAREFNLMQDPISSQILFDSGVPLVVIPCLGVASHLLTTVAEIERYVEGQGEIGNYLAQIFKAYKDDHFAWAKEIWDISAIGYLINPEWVPTHLVHSPILSDQLTWSIDHSRHFVRFASHVKRNPIFADLFAKLARGT